MRKTGSAGTIRPNIGWAVDLIAGRWAGSAGGNLTRTEGRGIASINASAAGIYTVTLDEPFNKLVSYSFTAGLTAGTAATQKIGNMNSFNATAGTITFSLVDCGATPALANVASTEELCVTLLLSSQGVPST